jgi:DNA-binding SARP family transcriptional activator
MLLEFTGVSPAATPVELPRVRAAPPEFRVLGSVEAGANGRALDLGPFLPRAVFAILLVEANRRVSRDQLVERIWPDRRPGRPITSLHGYLSRLRKALSRADSAAEITRNGDGYALIVDEHEIDLCRFRNLLDRAHATTEANVRERLLGQALRLRRGEPLAGMDLPWARGVRDAVDIAHVAASIEYNDCLLAAGKHAQLIPSLYAQVVERPLDERLAGQLMSAFHRAGRRSEAIAHYHRLRKRLVAELGIRPSSDLRRLYDRIVG